MDHRQGVQTRREINMLIAERLAAACEQMNDRTAAMYLALAESWSKKGQDKEAGVGAGASA